MSRPSFAVRVFVALCALASSAAAQQPARRALRLDDLYRLKEVSDPQLSPEGAWVAYTVTTLDSTKDKSNADVWMAKWDGSQNIRLTSSPDGERSPRWSPDGKYLAFVSARGESKSGAQVWLLDRTGGEAQQLTKLKGGVAAYEWSPDAKRLVLVSQDPDPDTTEAKSEQAKTPKPIVIDRFQFKQDGDGYLGKKRGHIYVFDVESRKSEQLTSGAFDDEAPAWSPDGTQIAFHSNRSSDPDRSINSDIYVMDAKAGAAVRQLTTNQGSDARASWSPDGRSIAYVSNGESKYHFYNLDRLTIVPAAGGAPRSLVDKLDRNVTSWRWSPNGASLVGLIEDDGAVYLGRIDVASGAIARLQDGRRVFSAITMNKAGRVAVLKAEATVPNEVFALDGRELRSLSRQNTEWLAEVTLAATEDLSAKAKDGNIVHGLLMKPVGFVAGQKYPTLLRIHGGPVSQDQHAFNFEREILAGAGYVVVTANYRGSSGRGEAYQRSIFADWGNKEVIDLIAITDEVVRLGIADPQRLGIGGWSYGGILTDYAIAKDTRFRAAISGAGVAFMTAMYGTDQYIFQYENEVGAPWKTPKLWEQLSYAFYHADRIRTPTLFMVGEKDFNVPAQGSEQMYQALKSLGVETQLVIYPGQFHGITIPSYRTDRIRRYVDWYDQYLKRPAQ